MTVVAAADLLYILQSDTRCHPILLQFNEYIRPSDEDFYKSVGEDACSEFKIDCTISDFTQNEAKNFIEDFAKKLEEVASDSAGKQMLEFAIAMYEKNNSGN